MTEKTLLVNPTPEVWSAHLESLNKSMTATRISAAWSSLNPWPSFRPRMSMHSTYFGSKVPVPIPSATSSRQKASTMIRRLAVSICSAEAPQPLMTAAMTIMESKRGGMASLSVLDAPVMSLPSDSARHIRTSRSKRYLGFSPASRSIPQMSPCPRPTRRAIRPS